MLEQILLHIHNRFIVGSKSGRWAIDSGTVEVDGLQQGQYFWVEGSVFNDGLHQYPADDLTDETFEGRILFLAIPNTLIELSEEIGAWCDENASILGSAYQSESFGGYSYTKPSGGSGGIAADGWQGHFRSRLNPWRKLA